MSTQPTKQLKADQKYRLVTNCRICDSARLKKYLDLGAIPLVNQLEDTAAKAIEVDRFPLEVLFCEECGLSQLSCVVNSGILFNYYPYRSSISKMFINHCREIAGYYVQKLRLRKDDLVLDIASNDGALLRQFKDLGIRVVGVDPAVNLALIASNNVQPGGIPTAPLFWGAKARAFIEEYHGRAKLVLGTNIFAHVDNVRDFLYHARNILTPSGKIVLEFPYLVNLINANAFDTVYHEHRSYFLINPLRDLANRFGLFISDIIETDIHGGSVLVELSRMSLSEPRNNCDKLFVLTECAQGFMDISTYEAFGKRVDRNIVELGCLLRSIQQNIGKIAAFGAAAKGVVLLNSLRTLKYAIDYIIDDTPEKQGKFSPGTGIPIVSRDILKSNPPDYLLILAWNFKDEIMASLRDSYKGKYIIPIPKVEVI